MASFSEIPSGLLNVAGDDDDDDYMPAPEASTNKDIVQNHVNELANLVRRKQRDQFKEYLHSIPKPDLHLDANVMDLQRNSVMHLIVLSGDLGILQAALECGAAVNLYENEDKETPLTLAAQIFPDGFVMMLHDSKKPKPKKVNSQGQNLLHAVVTAKATARPWPDRVVMVRELVTVHNVSIKQQDNNGYTPCAWARQHFLGLGSDAETIIELLSKSKSKSMNASKAEFVSFYKSPLARILFVAILIVLHSLQYATETYDRPPLTTLTAPRWYEVWSNGTKALLGDAYRDPSTHQVNYTHSPYNLTSSNTTAQLSNDTYIGYATLLPPGKFPFCFMAFNMLGSNWYAETNMIATHVGMLFAGLVLGAILVMVLIRELLGKQLLSLRIFGADSDRAANAVLSSGVSDEVASSIAFMVDELDHPASSHGSAYMVLAGAFVGLYCGALSLNKILETAFKDKNGSAFLITDTIDAVDGVGLLRAAWVISLLIDWLVMILVVDTMLQLLSANSPMVPDPAYHGFGSGMYASLPTWRTIWWYGGALLGWLGLFIGFGVKSHNDKEMAFVAPMIDTASPGQQLAIVSLSVMMTFLIVSQDWTLPYRRHTVELVVPFLSEARSNLMWFLWFCFSITMALDMRLFVGLLKTFINTQDLSKPLKRFELAMVLLPCAVGIVVFLSVLIRTSTRLSPTRRGTDDETRSQSAAGGGGVAVPNKFKSSDGRAGRQQRSPLDKPLGGGGGGGIGLNVSATSLGSGGRKNIPTKAAGGNRAFDDNAPARPPSSSTGRKAQANDIWAAAAMDDVVKMCTMLEKDPTLVNQRGGPGIECDALSRTVTVMPPGAQAGPDYAAAPIHYAIAANARGTLTALLSRGANARLRTVHGMFSCRELLEIIGNKEMLDVMYPPIATVPASTGAASPTGALPSLGRKSFHRATPRGGADSSSTAVPPTDHPSRYAQQDDQANVQYNQNSAFGSPQYSQDGGNGAGGPLSAAQLAQHQQQQFTPSTNQPRPRQQEPAAMAHLPMENGLARDDYRRYDPAASAGPQPYNDPHQQQRYESATTPRQHSEYTSQQRPLRHSPANNQPPMRRELQLQQQQQQGGEYWHPVTDGEAEQQQQHPRAQQQQPYYETSYQYDPYQSQAHPQYYADGGSAPTTQFQQQRGYYPPVEQRQDQPPMHYYSPTNDAGGGY